MVGPLFASTTLERRAWASYPRQVLALLGQGLVGLGPMLSGLPYLS